jgi:ATP/maltotriose-dependent transcriptional regulator MalT
MMPDRTVVAGHDPMHPAADNLDLAADGSGLSADGVDLPADGIDLMAAVQALEARKALLAGSVAALTAPDELAAELLEAALADPDARLWPFDLARVHLLYGERLRRSREIIRSRHHLRAALAGFERLGESAWANHAAAELAATSPARRQETSGDRRLTTQELQVAELAAGGMTNKEIAGRLHLGPDGVKKRASALYRKLGVRNRTEAVQRAAQLLRGT